MRAMRKINRTIELFAAILAAILAKFCCAGFVAKKEQQEQQEQQQEQQRQKQQQQKQQHQFKQCARLTGQASNLWRRKQKRITYYRISKR